MSFPSPQYSLAKIAISFDTVSEKLFIHKDKIVYYPSE